jgi:ATP-dependent RNA helicase DeaD
MITFNELDLNQDIQKAIADLGFENPTDIQEKTIPAFLEGEEDIIALAQTGTGKTAAFGLPLLEQIAVESRNVQAIILCPTRELCLQITKDMDAYSKYVKGLSVLAVYGGARIDTQIAALKKGPQIVVGTPGRTLDLINRRMLKIDKINWLILDEADEMLNMGFREDLDSILETTPDEKRTLLFSATMPDGVRRITKSYMSTPIEITSGKKNTGATNVSHEYYVVRASDRYQALKRLADVHPDVYGIVFCRTRHETKDVAEKLINDGYNADALHGDLSQAQRDHVMQRFRTRNLQLLIATDVAARGLDINDLTHVINYNLPDDPEVYIHRSGRTGRAGKMGISIVISHSREGRRIKELENLVGKKFTYMPVPSGHEICEKRLYSLMDRIEKIEVDEDQIGPFLPAIYKKLEWLDHNELLKRIVSVEFNRFLEYYRNANDLNVSSSSDESGRRNKKRSSSSSFARFYINIGGKQKVKTPELIGLINEHTKRRDIEIGKVEIQNNFSFFEIDSSASDLLMDSFKDTVFEGVDLVVQPAKENPHDGRRSDSGSGYGGRSGGGYRSESRSGSGSRSSSGYGSRSGSDRYEKRHKPKFKDKDGKSKRHRK